MLSTQNPILFVEMGLQKNTFVRLFCSERNQYYNGSVPVSWTQPKGPELVPTRKKQSVVFSSSIFPGRSAPGG